MASVTLAVFFAAAVHPESDLSTVTDARSATLSPSGRYLAVVTAREDGDVLPLSIYNAQSGRRLCTTHTYVSTPPRWHPAKPILAFGGGTASNEQYLRLDVTNCTLSRIVKADPTPACWLSPKNLLLTYGIDDYAVQDPQTGKFIPLPAPPIYKNGGTLVRLISGPQGYVAAELMREIDRPLTFSRSLAMGRPFPSSGTVE